MQSKLLLIPLLLAAWCVASAASPPPLSKWQRAHLQQFEASAPADEYFGKMKMSYLGIDNTFHDASISAGDHTTDDRIIGKIAFAEDALEAWAAKYPRDPQLARSYFLAVEVERKIWVKANQEHAWTYFNRIVQLFPDSYFGKTLKRDLSIGFTEHYYADAVACPTPMPTPLPTDSPVPTPSPTAPPRGRRSAPTPSPSPSPTPEPTLEPTPMPSPTAIETTLGPGHTVQILPQPCTSPIPESTPTVTPSAPSTPSSPSASPAQH